MSFPVPYFWICLLSAEFHKCFDILGAKPKASASYPPGASICVGDWDVIAPTPDSNTPPPSSCCWDLAASRRNLDLQSGELVPGKC